MKKLPLLVLGVVAFTATQAFSACPPNNPPKNGPDGDGAGDPAFAYVDPASTGNSLAKKIANFLGLNAAAKPSAKSEQAAWTEASKEMAAHPEKAYSMAMTIWTQGYSTQFKKMALTKASTLARETEQIESMEFLMACLDDPNAQVEACRTLAKGTGLERQLATKRLALIASNPQMPAQ